MAKRSKDSNQSATVDELPCEQPREAVLVKQFREDMRHWIRENPKTADRAWALIEDIMRSPFDGIGKPEPLKHDKSNTWSRRLTQEDRIVYRVSHTKIEFLQARYHY